jgi:hypothetical protein
MLPDPTEMYGKGDEGASHLAADHGFPDARNAGGVYSVRNVNPVSKESGMSEDVAIAQIVTAITTVFYAAVFAIGYYLIIRGNRQTLREMRQERLSGGRPQIIVEMSLLNLPMVELVVRNVSGGAAKDITFDISDVIEDSSGFALSALRYLREGIPFLGPGEKITCLWDHLDRLVTDFDEKGLNEGIAVRVSYKDLTEEAYATEWGINPLLYEGLRYDAKQLAQGPSDPGVSASKVGDDHGHRTVEDPT